MSTTVERLMVEVGADTGKARTALASLDRQSETMTSRANKRFGGMARTMGLAFGGAAIVSGITKTIGLAMNFDKTMRLIGVNAGISGRQLDNLGSMAKQMGADTVFSAQDAADAMLNLSKGGLTAAQIRAGALKQTLTLAAAGGMDLASSADIMANSLNMFGIRADHADRVTTALAGAANASTASVDSLRMALSQVGSGARGAGLNIQTTVAALAEFDNAGIKGSDAGTSLKTMLQRLVPQTKRAATAMKDNNLQFSDAHGNFLSLDKIAQNLHDHLGKLSAVERQRALNTIFGSDASRAAAVLMRGGAKTLREYTKAARDTAITQKMANTAMDGASGAWENFKGSVETSAISLGQKMLPTVTKVLNAGTDLLAGANRWGPGVAHDFDGIVASVKPLGPFVKDLANLVGSLASGFQSLPQPVKSTAVELGIAALVFPRLASMAVGAGTAVGGSLTTMTAKAAQFRAEMSYTATRTQALGGALRSVAGPAGMGLLLASTHSSNDALKVLGTTGGAALMGFAVGGPVGAAVGGLSGLILTLGKEAKWSGEAAKASRANYDGLASTLDNVTGATTAATRAFVLEQLQRSKAMQALASYGVSQRTAVSAAMGEANARKAVSAALQAQRRDYAATNKEIAHQQYLAAHSGSADQINQAHLNVQNLRAQADAEKAAIDAVRSGVGATKAAVAAKRRDIMATQELTGKLRGIPKSVRTRILAEGIMPTVKGIANVAHRYHLVPKQVRTLIAATGVPTTVKAVERAKSKMKDLDKTKVTLRTYTNSVRAGAHSAEGAARDGGTNTRKGLEAGPKKAKADLAPFTSSVKSGAKSAAGAAHSGGTSVGSALKAGVLGGFFGTAQALAAEAASAVRSAVAAARAAAKIKSPSRVMRDKVGKPLADGIVVGFKGQLKRRLHEVEDDLTKAMNRLSGIRGKRSEFMGNITTGMTSQASVTNAGSTAATIATNLATQARKVVQFAHMLRRLRRMGYDDQIIRDIAAAGVEGGFDAAKALLSASAAQERSINRSYRTIYKTAHDSAKTMGNAMYGSGIRVAEGIVAGLRKHRHAIMAELKALEKRRQAEARRKSKRAARDDSGPSGHTPGPRTNHTVTKGAVSGGNHHKTIVFNFTTHNPRAEAQSKTTNKALARVAAMNLLA